MTLSIMITILIVMCSTVLSHSDGVKVYVAQVDERWSQHLTHRASNQLCDNQGYGAQWNVPELFNTSHLAAGLIIDSTFARSSIVTQNIHEADLVYYPTKFGHLAPGDREGCKFWDTYSSSSAPSLMILDAPEMEFECDHPSSAQVMFGTVEKSPFPRSNDLAFTIPYPSRIHFGHNNSLSTVYQDLIGEKDVFASGHWLQYNRFAQLLVPISKQCLDRPTRCTFVKSGPTESTLQLSARSVFCLQPRGETLIRSDFYEAILLGCINVVFEADMALPFSSYIPWYQMIVFIPRNIALDESSNIIDILTEIPSHRVAAMQQSIAKHRHVLQYSLEPRYDLISKDSLLFIEEYDDAATVIVKEALRKSRVRSQL